MKYVSASVCIFSLLCLFGCDPEDDGSDPLAGDGGVDASGPDTDPKGPDGGVLQDGGSDDSSSVVRFVLPTSNVLTSATPVKVRAVCNAPVDTIDLMIDGTLFATLPPPFEYSISALELAEGVHSVVPRARMGLATVSGPGFQLTVDRTAPSLVSVTPTLAGGAIAPDIVPIVVTFDEELEASSTLTIDVSAYNPLGANFTVTREGSTITYRRDRAWPEGTSIYYYASGTVRDAAGNSRSIVVPTTSFTTWSYWSRNGALYADATAFTQMNDAGEYALLWQITNGYYYPATLGFSGRVADRNLQTSSLPTMPDGSKTPLALALDDHGKLTLVVNIGYADTHPITETIAYTYDIVGDSWSSVTLVPDVTASTYLEGIWSTSDGGVFARVLTTTQLPDASYVTTRAYSYRAPGATTFAPLTTGFDAIPAGRQHIWAADGGRLCGVDVDTIDASNGRYVLRCLRASDGGASGAAIALRDFEFATAPGFRVATGARGDAAVLIASSVRFYDASTHTVASETLAAIPNEISVGRSGDFCATFLTQNPTTYATELRVGKRLHTATSTSLSALITDLPLSSYSYSHQLGADGAGHCFVASGSDYYSSSYPQLVHDATTTGAFARAHLIGGSNSHSKLAVGGPNHALYIYDNTNYDEVYAFVGHD